MSEVKTVGDEHQGHKFDIHVAFRPAGYTYFLDVHLPGVEPLQINSGDAIYENADGAHHAARLRGWEIIDEFVKASAL